MQVRDLVLIIYGAAIIAIAIELAFQVQHKVNRPATIHFESPVIWLDEA